MFLRFYLPSTAIRTRGYVNNARNLPISRTQRTQGRNIPVQGNPSLRHNGEISNDTNKSIKQQRAQNDPRVISNLSQSDSQTVPTRFQNHPKAIPKPSNIYPTSPQNDPPPSKTDRINKIKQTTKTTSQTDPNPTPARPQTNPQNLSLCVIVNFCVAKQHSATGGNRTGSLWPSTHELRTPWGRFFMGPGEGGDRGLLPERGDVLLDARQKC